MSWIQENKFTAGVLGAAVAVSGVLFYLGFSARSEAEDIRDATNSAVSETNNLKRMKPFPSSDNKQLVITKVANFTEEALEFQKSLVAFRPDKLENLSENAFGAKVSEHREKLYKYYKEKGVALREGGKSVAFGLEEYRDGKMAKAGATQVLNYERKALDWMFTKLADAGPDSLDNVYRTRVREESAATNQPRSKKGVKKGLARVSSKVESVYRPLPIEITFTGTEKALKEFLKELSNSEDYFFITRAVRVRNLDDESPDIKDGEFPKIVGANDGFGATGFDEVAEVDQPILKQVTGNEKIKVHLKLDLALFKKADKVPFPGKTKLDKPQSKAASPSESGASTPVK